MPDKEFSSSGRKMVHGGALAFNSVGLSSFPVPFEKTNLLEFTTVHDSPHSQPSVVDRALMRSLPFQRVRIQMLDMKVQNV